MASENTLQMPSHFGPILSTCFQKSASSSVIIVLIEEVPNCANKTFAMFYKGALWNDNLLQQ